MDALMRHGGYKYYSDKDMNVFRYSEHAGLLDFNATKLERVVVSGNTTRVDEGDDDIFLPEVMIDMYDYEYIFHTHPPTPRPGGRAELGVLYEFPSIGDIFHFLDHHNGGKTQGSVVIAAEGMYIIRKYTMDTKKIRINEDKMFRGFNYVSSRAQTLSLRKYGDRFSTTKFYSKIAQDDKYIKMINKILNKYSLHIDYYPRIKDKKGRWIIDTVYLPVYPVEARV
jgi:hypothetical protein